ncbi:pPIWI_RE_Y domain-containing protein [Streptomyces malaysiensis]|uniref:pPIWI-RE three-gene island domain-containing protein n=1 Tax=Streptomyces autolyticus TaxID=75293 RepID=A0ABN4WC47_9ACTN|nr:hypothetical protein [Streptomyces autolyticus]AQA14849.1 hypothetical protein BV401_34990 [Streptomyces autolyticus]
MNTGKPAEIQGAELLCGIARSLIALGKERNIASYSLPYPRLAQLTLDRVVLHCALHRKEPPTGVPGLAEWWERSAEGNHPLPLPAGFLKDGSRLLDPGTGKATRTCAELASYGPYGTLDRDAADLLDGLEAACKHPELFERCRTFLIARPVIDAEAPIEMARTHAALTVWRRVRHLYAPPADHEVVRGKVAVCAGCGLPARADEGERTTWCESGRCTVGTAASVHPADRKLLLPYSLRLFLSLPGATETRVVAGLRSRGIFPELVSGGLGAYGFTDPVGVKWVMRVLDREEPALLADRATRLFAQEPHRSLVALPDELLHRTPGYRDAFQRHVPPGVRISLVPEGRVADVWENPAQES